MNKQGNLGLKILLVEDEPLVTKAIKMLLEYEGYEVQTAENGETALALFAQSRFDLVITDFSMTGMTGGMLAARLKKIHPGQPIILATASIYKFEENNHPLRIVDLILDKPFTLSELRAAIARLNLPPKSG